jgi:hypothetical protein
MSRALSELFVIGGTVRLSESHGSYVLDVADNGDRVQGLLHAEEAKQLRAHIADSKRIG